MISIQKIKNLFAKFNLFHYFLIFLLGLILISFAVYIFFLPKDNNNLQNQNKQNISNDVNVIHISLDQEFTLKKDQVAILGDNLLQIKILDFINSPCPEGAQCIWSGLGIIFEYTNSNGEKLTGNNLTKAFGYKIIIIDSDYKEYVLLNVQEDINKEITNTELYTLKS